MNLNELQPFGEWDKYIDNPMLDEYSQRPVSSLWETQANLIIQPRKEPWGKPNKTFEDTVKPGDGRNGKDGTDGTDGEPGPQGPPGPAGTDASIPSGVIVFATVSSLGAGWQLCDGTNGTPDLRNRFVVTVGSSYAYGETGGYKWHGQTENNHNDHRMDHYHCFPALTYFNCVDTTNGSTSIYALTSDYVPCCGDNTGKVGEWCGTDNPPVQLAPESSCFSPFYAKHYGPYNSNQDTDNRPPYIALYAHMKI